MLASVWRLSNVIQPYAWGSRTAIASLQGRPTPSAQPQAELWMGAHPRAPSRLVDGRDTSLRDAIEARPEALLGASVLRRSGPRLPLLLKVLAAAEPLSLQAHPDARRAREGFEAEDAAGIDRDAPHRNFRDPYDKPELVCALGPFTALCGFRPVSEAAAVVEALGVPGLRAVAAPLWDGPAASAMPSIVRALLTAAEPGPLVEAVVDACAREAATESSWRSTWEWTVRLGRAYPGDPGVLVALLLNRVELSAGQALFLGPGRLHCYLEGLAVEIMGASDNVLRGGLTRKHVDVPQLLRVLDGGTEPVEVVRPRPISPVESVYDAPTEAFSLSRLELALPRVHAQAVAGPELLLCVSGQVRLHGGDAEPIELPAGASAFVPASQGSYRVEAVAPAALFRATVGSDPDP